MKKITYLILFLLFFSNALSVIYAQAPSDENFESYPDDVASVPVGVNGRTVGDLIFFSDNTSKETGIGTDGTLGQTAFPTSNRYFSFLFPEAGTIMIGFESASGEPFKLVSFAISNVDGMNSAKTENFIVRGFDENGVEVASDNLNMAVSDGSGSISYNRLESVPTLQDGTLIFNSDWENVQRVTFTGTDSGVGTTNAPSLSFDNLDFEPAVLPTTAPTVSTSPATSITTTGVTFNGEVTNDGGATVTDRGFVYSSSDNTPTIGETGVTQVTDGSGTGIFSEAVAGLSASTTYYYQAYATNSQGTSYGGVQSFNTTSAGVLLSTNPTLIFTANTGDITGDNIASDGEGGSQAISDIDIQIFNISDVNGTFLNSLSWKDHSFLYSADLNYSALTYDNNNQGNKGMSIKSADGSNFRLIQFKYYNWGEISSFTNTIKGYRDGSEVASMTFNGFDADYDPITVTLNASFSNVDDVRIYISDPGWNEDGTTNHSINNIQVTSAVAATAPSVATASASDVTSTTANLGGNVTSDGGAAVTERGIVYNTTGTPNVDGDTKVQIGSGDGVFTDDITGLTPVTTYYVRAYAINSEGTSYGSEESFTTTKIQLAISSQNLTISKSYDGTNSATVSDIVLSGVRPGDDVTITGEATYNNADVGENKTITVVYSLGGADGNPAATLNNLTPGGGETASDKNFANISKWAQQFTASESGVISSLKLNLYRTNSQSGSFVVELWSGSGTIPTSQLIVLKTLDWSNVPLNNTATTTADFIELINLENSYSVVSGTKYWIVVSQPSTGPFAKRWAVNGSGNETASYNANQDLWTQNGTALDLGYQIEIETSGSYIAPIDFVVNDGVITAKELTITGLSGNDKVYDGTTTATVSGTAILNGVETGDEVTMGGTPVFIFDNANVGTGIGITASGYEISGADAGNYYLTAPIGLSADITATAPTVTTTVASGVTATTATLGGEVTDNGGATLTERGIVYNTTGNPNVDDDTKVQIGSGDGVFTDEITGLTEGTTYYVRAYAINSEGTSYGSEESFITSTLGLEDGYLKNAISLYPNPVNDVLYITNNIKVENVLLFDVLGKTIDNIAIVNNAINVSNLEIGIYILKIETKTGSVVKRIVKK